MLYRPQLGVLKIYTGIILCLFMFMFSVASVQAEAVIMEEKGPIYNIEAVSPFQSYYNNQNEAINLDTGSLTLTVNDLHIPGRGG